MVEGYTDVISMHQCRLLHRFTSNIVLLYDGDNAGIHAALRGTDMLLEEEMNVKVLFLPDGNDPDRFACSGSAAGAISYESGYPTG